MRPDATQRYAYPKVSVDLPGCRLTVTEGPDAGKSCLMKEGVVQVGTKSDNHLALSDQTVSREHCIIIQRMGGYLLRDLDSKNGTLVDGVRVREAYLSPGAAIQVGKTEIRFEAMRQRVEIEPVSEDRFGELVGRSPAMRSLFGILGKVAPTDLTILVEGETGVGKELVARAIHAHSARRNGPFYIFDCGAVAETLMGSELFGHVKGAFTGAIASRKGAFETARGGSIFLDEVGDLSLDLQPKLLRAIDERTIKPVGADNPIPIDVRIISATNRNLVREVNRGKFREDLYYRLSGVHVSIQPLREHRSDIPLLIEHFLKKYKPADARAKRISNDILSGLNRHDWPGNVRELENVIRQAIALAEGTEITSLGPLPPQAPPPETGLPSLDTKLPLKEARNQWVKFFEREYLVRLMREHGGDLDRMAQAAGVHRKYLSNLLRLHQIEKS